MTDVGGIVYDKDATVMEIGRVPDIETDAKAALIHSLKQMPMADREARDEGMRLFSDSAPITAEDVHRAERCAHACVRVYMCVCVSERRCVC
jgi:hypothetical protein